MTFAATREPSTRIPGVSKISVKPYGNNHQKCSANCNNNMRPQTCLLAHTAALKADDAAAQCRNRDTQHILQFVYMCMKKYCHPHPPYRYFIIVP